MTRVLPLGILIAMIVALSYEFVDEFRDDDLENSLLDRPALIGALLIIEVGLLVWVVI